MKKKSSNIEELEGELADAKARLRLAEDNALQAQKALLSIQNSLTWKLTLPIRVGIEVLLSLFLPRAQRVSKNELHISNSTKQTVVMGKVSPQEHYEPHGNQEERLLGPASDMQRYKQIFAALMQVRAEEKGYSVAINSYLTTLRRDGVSGVLSRLSTVAGYQPNMDYQKWVQLYDTPSPERTAAVYEEINSFDHQPLISIILPSYKPKMAWFKEAIASVYKQTYQNWELCIADDASNLPELNQYLKELQSKDTRVKVVFRKDNGHISAASNSALTLATGEWVALLDHDDLLHEYALFYIAKEILTHSDAMLIYSDEDKVDEHSVRRDPYFKPNWNLELFYSQNMFSHLGAYNKQLLDDIGGFRLGLEGAQDYDLALRCIEKISADKIRHIPRILYHWRVHDKSTSKDPEAKPYAMMAGERALNEHFKRSGQDASAELIGFGYRIRFGLPIELPLVSVVIPTRNNHDLLKCCLDSILGITTYPNYEIVVVDNGSDSSDSLNYLDQIMSIDSVTVLTDSRPFNYSALNNRAVEIARGEVICLLNDDTEIITADWLNEMVGIAIRPDVGAVGAKLLYADGSIQHAGIICGMGVDKVAGHAHYGMHSTHNGYFGRSNLTSSFSAVTGACMVLRKSLYKKVLGMNEVDLIVAYNDVDLCLKIATLGYRNIYTPYAQLYHHESASRGADMAKSNKKRFASEVEYMRTRWSDFLQEDPMYSPNLSLDHADFRFAYPPRLTQ